MRRPLAALQQLAVAVLLPCAARAAWSAVGPPIVHTNVVAADLDFLSAAQTGPPVLPLGAPVLAVGHYSDAGTTTDFVAWLAAGGGGGGGGGAWVTAAPSHTPYFAQNYDYFALRHRRGGPGDGGEGRFYLGLHIAFEALGSVLRRSNASAVDQEWVGCWAFGGSVFDFEINDAGDMRLVGAVADGDAPPGNASLAQSTYANAGWDCGSPACDTFSPFRALPRPAGGGLDSLTLVRAGAELHAAATSPGAVEVLAVSAASTRGGGGDGAEGGAAAGVIGGPWPGSLAGIAHGGSGANATTCVAFFENNATAVRVRCMPLAARAAADWSDCGLALHDAAADGGGLPPALVITNAGVIVVAALASADAPGTLRVAASPLGACAGAGGQWEADDIAAGNAVTDFDVKFDAAGGAVYAVITTGAPPPGFATQVAVYVRA